MNIDEYDEAKLRELNVSSLKKIGTDIAGAGWFKMELTLSGSPASQITVGYLSALVNQGWISIRQNEIIIRELQKLNTTK